MNPVNGLEPCDQSDRQKQTKVEDKIFWKMQVSSLKWNSEKVVDVDNSMQ